MYVLFNWAFFEYSFMKGGKTNIQLFAGVGKATIISNGLLVEH